MIALLQPVAAVCGGMILGCLLTMTYAFAMISRVQERMQRKVRYWQTEAAMARETATRLARQVKALGQWPGPPQGGA